MHPNLYSSVQEAFEHLPETYSDLYGISENKFHSGLPRMRFDLAQKQRSSLLVTDDTDMHKLDVKCNRCSHVQEKILVRQNIIESRTQMLNSPCPECSSTDLDASERDLVDYLALLSSKTGTSIEVISGKAEHGAMLGSLGKIGAILRYNPGHAKLN